MIIWWKQIYIYREREGNHKSEKAFLLKIFRHKSSTVKIFCPDTHLNFFDILQFYKYVAIKLLYKDIGEQLNYKKNFKLKKLVINCYRYPHLGNNIPDNANCYTKKEKKTLWPLFMDGDQLPQG